MIADKKLRAVRSILFQMTYGYDSGLYQSAEKALLKLSLDDLNAIGLLTDLRVTEAVERAKDETRPIGALR